MTDSAGPASRRDAVIVAQRLIAGKRLIPTNQNPVGTEEVCPPAQSSLRDLLSSPHQLPAMNRWADPERLLLIVPQRRIPPKGAVR